MSRASYRDAIAWLAENDVPEGDGASLSLAVISESKFTEFASMLYSRTEDEIAIDVLRVRVKARGEQLRAAREAKKP